MALARIALILCLFAFVQEGICQSAQMNSATTIPQYAGKTADQWVSEVIRLAVTIRATEEEYERSLRECAKQGKTTEDQTSACIRANHAFFASQSARNEYQRMLNTVSRTSLPIEWLRSHFTWVRFGPDWKDNQ